MIIAGENLKNNLFLQKGVVFSYLKEVNCKGLSNIADKY